MLELTTPDMPPLLANALVVPSRVAGHELTIIAETYCRDDHIYFIDGKGNVHLFKYVGVNINTTGVEK